MKITRVLTVCLILILVCCELIGVAADAENDYAQITADAVSIGEAITINDSADLEALGLGGSVSFVDEEEPAVRPGTKYEDKNTPTDSGEVPMAVSPNAPDESPKAAIKHFGDCIDADLGFGTENNVNAASEGNITEDRTWYIWGSCRVDYTINVYPGRTLTIYIKKRRAMSAYGDNEVARIIRGSSLASDKPMFRVYRGAKLYIYGHGDSTVVSSYNEYYHLQITNGSLNGTCSIVDFVNDTSEGGSSSTGNATFVCERVTFRNNMKSGPGGAIVINAPLAKFDLKWCGFSNLDATNGGAIFVSNALETRLAEMVLQGCKFDDCNATTHHGGAINFDKGAKKASDGTITNELIKITKLTLTGTSFNNCTAKGNGGAININGASNHDDGGNAGLLGTLFGSKSDGGGIYMNNCTFTGCKADTNGGAFNFSARTTLINADNTTFDKCESKAGGSAIYLGEGAVVNSFVATNATFSNNKACTGNSNYGGTFRTVGLASVSATLTNCTFNNNTSQDGGAIYWNSGRVYTGSTYIVSMPSLTLNGCTIRNNTASRNGGGVYNESKLILQNTNIYSNTAVDGGGISMRNYNNSKGQLPSSLSLELNSTTNVYSNTATDSGGGIHFELRDSAMESQVPSGVSTIDYKLVLTGAKIYNNTATVNGGGVCFESLSGADTFFVFDIELNSGSIYSNTAVNGGGIYATSVDHVLGITINGGVIGGSGTPNTASGNGGGVYTNTNKVTLRMNNGSIAYNKATTHGGGVYSNNSTIYYSGGSMDSNNAGSNGGAMYVNGGLAEFTGGTISNNTSTNGGGIYVHSAGTVNMNPVKNASGNVTSRSSISDNIASASGGGLYVHGASKISVNDVIMNDNTAQTGNGGGIAVANGIVTVTGGDFYSNSAPKGNGGGIMAQGTTTTLTIIGGTVGSTTDIALANTAARGGGIDVQNHATLSISNGCIGYNKALYMYDANNALVSDTGVGGGIAILNCNATITGGIIIGNEAENKGGGVYAYNSDQTKTVTFSGGSVGTDADGNPAPNIANYGGGVYVNNIIFNMTKNADVSGSITNNVALIDGGGLYVIDVLVTIAGDISDNIAANNGGGVYLESAAISFTGNIEGNKAGYELTAESEVPVSGQGNGGGIYVSTDFAEDTSVNEAVINGTINGNYANVNGGGVYAKGGTVVTISGGDIHSNHATNGNGGGVYATDSNTFIQVLGGNIGLEDMPNVALNGGGVYIDGARFILDKTASSVGSIGYNLALAEGGGGYFYSTNVQIKGNINNNTSKGNGGGIYLNEATVTVEGDIIDNVSTSVQELRATVGNGGGACLVNGSVLNMGANGNITGNATDGDGGGIAAYNGSTVNLGGGLITENTANYGFGGGVYANDSLVNITGSDIIENTAKNGGGVCATQGGELVMTGGYLRYNTAVGTPDDSVKTAFHLDQTLAGVGGGIYLSNGVEADLSTYELTGQSYGIYGNLADFAADDVFANGVNTQLTLPRALSMTLTGTEFERATGWFEDYAKGDTMYTSGLNGNSAIGGVRYKTADRSVVAYVNEADAADKATETTVYINTANTYVCLTLGVAKAGYGEITILKSGENIDPEQLFVFTVSGRTNATGELITFSVTIKGEGSATIVDVPDGVYTITEITDWAWRYELASIVVSNGTIDVTNCSGTVTVGAGDASPDIEFFNRLVKDKWLDGNSNVAKNVAGEPNQGSEPNNLLVADLPKKKEIAPVTAKVL